MFTQDLLDIGAFVISAFKLSHIRQLSSWRQDRKERHLDKLEARSK
jgi:hypothetical protein